MKKGRLIAIVIFVGLIFLAGYMVFHAFDPVYDSAEIKQNIGGVLLCSSTTDMDIHSWQHDIVYKYKHFDSDTPVTVGYGTYFERQWKKDEQLVQFDKWTILKTGGSFKSDAIIIGDFKTNKWNRYDFTPEKIESDSLWHALKIPSLLNYCCAETHIDSIWNGEIYLHYKYRVNEKLPDNYNTMRVFYKVDSFAGQPVMIKIIR
ncbi:MAG: hypothetical protein P4L41_01475 [Flavipsychrobacter sp.]|nr:hypothetical protein [Flavipsychrobacter sp.]